MYKKNSVRSCACTTGSGDYFFGGAWRSLAELGGVWTVVHSTVAARSAFPYLAADWPGAFCAAATWPNQSALTHRFSFQKPFRVATP